MYLLDFSIRIPLGTFSILLSFVIYAVILPAGWIARSAVILSHLLPRDEGHVPKHLWKFSVDLRIIYLVLIYFME